MIQKIKIQNFQSHKNTELNFQPGVNAIIGSTAAGKSSIIRAINLVLNNKPAGVDFIQFGEDFCKIELEIEDKTIVREKNKSGINSYVVNGNELVAFGQSVPDEVQETSKFNYLNFQHQWDSPFLLSNNSGEVNRILNRVINLEMIDISMSKAEKMRRTYKNKLESLQKEKVNLEKEILDFAWLAGIEKILIEAELFDDNIRKNETDCDSIENIIVEYEKSFHKIGMLDLAMQNGKRCLEVEPRAKKLEDKIVKEKMLLEFVLEYESCENLIKKYEEKLKEIPDNFDKLVKLSRDLEQKQEKSVQIFNFILHYAGILCSFDECSAKLDKIKIEYNEMDIKECPICGTVLDKRRIIGENIG